LEAQLVVELLSCLGGNFTGSKPRCRDLPMSATFSRRDLYDQVWSEPIRSIASRLGVSDVWLKKCCAKADIPVPPRGYWAKFHAGKSVVRAKLPLRAPGQPDSVQIGQDSYRYWARVDLNAELAKPPPAEPVFDEPIEEVRARAAEMIGKTVYRRDLASPHPAISKILADDEARRRKGDGVPYRLRWSEPLFASPFERRRLKVLSSLFQALAKVGASPWISDDEARNVGLVVGAQRVAISLDHPDAKPDRDGHFRTREGFADVLRLAITGTGKVWADTAESALESHLAEIAIELLVAGEAQLRASAQDDYERACRRRLEFEEKLAAQKAEAIRLARDLAVKAERERRRNLLRMAAEHRKAEQIRGLIEEVVRLRGADPSQAEGVAKWAEWAREVADRADPTFRLSFDAEGRACLAEPTFPQPGTQQCPKSGEKTSCGP
jgi:hypothetical protein